MIDRPDAALAVAKAIAGEYQEALQGECECRAGCQVLRHDDDLTEVRREGRIMQVCSECTLPIDEIRIDGQWRGAPRKLLRDLGYDA